MGQPSPSRPTFGIRLKAFVIWLLVRMLLATVRVRILYPERLERARATGRALIYAFWHGRQLGLFKANPERELAVMTSLSRDGTLQSLICHRFGLEVVRGSSSRAGLSGLVAMSRVLRRGVALGIAVDGPRGPAHQAKPGAAALALACGCPVVPITVGFSRSWVLTRAWDRFRIPKPFCTAWVAYGEPLGTPSDQEGRLPEQVADQVGQSLGALTEEVDAAASR